jgi:hypothetical protein
MAQRFGSHVANATGGCSRNLNTRGGTDQERSRCNRMQRRVATPSTAHLTAAHHTACPPHGVPTRRQPTTRHAHHTACPQDGSPPQGMPTTRPAHKTAAHHKACPPQGMPTTRHAHKTACPPCPPSHTLPSLPSLATTCMPHWVPQLATHHVKPSSSRSDAGAPTTSVLNLKAGSGRVIKVHSQGNELGKVSRGCVRVPAAGCCPLGGIVSCVREVGEGVLDSARPLTITSYPHAARNSGAYCAHTAWAGRGHCRVQH